VSEAEIPEAGFDREGDLLENPVLVSPLVWCLAYRWPVHQIGPDHMPAAPLPDGTELVVYRRRNDQVSFMAVNAVTLRLIELLRTGVTGGDALASVAAELSDLDSKVVYEQGLATMRRLRDAEILLGAQPSSGSVG
jgi:hypothetical protein